MHREDTREDLGTAKIQPSSPIPVGAYGTWEIQFTAGSMGIQPGGVVRFTIPHGFTAPQTNAFFDPGFVTVDTGATGVDLQTKVISTVFCRLDPTSGHSGASGRNIFVRVTGGNGLSEGETISLTYGDLNYYGNEPFSHAGVRARELAGSAEFIVAVDPDGNRTAPYSGYARILNSPILEILPGSHTKTFVRLPSDIIEGTVTKAHILKVDQYNNPISVETPEIQVITREGDFGRVNIQDTRGTHPSNPARMHPHKPEEKIFWGDIHGHSQHSDGLGTLDYYFSFARDIAHIDFTAVTDHDDIGPRLADEEWDLIKAKTKEYHIPGKLITFLGHEYRNGKCDMNLYYPGDEGEILRGTDGDFQDAKIWSQRVKQQKGMIVPHMHFGADMSGFDPTVYRVMEVYSSHGSAEHRGCPREIPYLRKQIQKSSESNAGSHIHDLLNQGYRLGFTAGSDTHSGRPGFSDWTRVTRTYRGGLTAVFAPKLTREALWAALYNRRCYATTGNRSVLSFTLNGVPMGSEIELDPEEARKLELICQCDGTLQDITIFRSGEPWVQEEVSGTSVKRQYKDSGSGITDWYYFRVVLEGGEMAWSSPIWVN